MANATYNRGLYHLGKYNWDADAVNIGVCLIKMSVYTFSRLHNTVADVIAGSAEASGAGYVRKEIAAGLRTIQEDDGSNASYLKITDGSVSWVGINAGANLAVVLFFVEGTGVADNTNDLLGYYDTGTNIPVVTNGGDITLNFSSSGALKLA